MNRYNVTPEEEELLRDSYEDGVSVAIFDGGRVRYVRSAARRWKRPPRNAPKGNIR